MTSWFNWVTPRRGGRTASVEVDDTYDLVKGEAAGLEDFVYDNYYQEFAEWCYAASGECPAGCHLTYRGGDD